VCLISRKFVLRRSKMLEFLDEIERILDYDAVSIYMPPGLSALEIGELIQKFGARYIPDELSQLASSSEHGALIFWGDIRKCLVLPPFPFKGKTTFSGYVVEPFRSLLTVDSMVGMILVRLGSYAIGICQGEKLITSKVGTGLVHGRHKKGGSSQQRFQRRRENQVREFLDRVCLHAREQLEPQMQLINYIAYGGPRQTVLLLQKRCPFLRTFGDRVLHLLDVPSPNQKVLGKTISRIWSSRVIDWQEE